MKAKRFALVTLLSAVALALAVEPVAAQSTTAELINELNGKLLYVAVPITILVQVVLFYTVWKFAKADEPKPTRENRRLEITWTVATAIILLFVGVASYSVLANPDVTHPADAPVAPEDDDVVVQAEAFQWGWNMTYPQHGYAQAPSGETGPRVVVPVDQEVYFEITSRDVLHAFHAPQLGLKQDAIPGQTNVIRTVPTETGTYQGYCAEYCGVAHSNMYFTVEVVSQEEYDQFIADQTSESDSAGGDSASGNSTAGNSTAGNSTSGSLVTADDLLAA
jgi:cytochrome c oxidase subunit 2